ncbi:MAG TPA: GntR family transcriptional regulator [Vineibacter sp.]|nr:GntR family transcriptional regulator [Vineibacter sp.]
MAAVIVATAISTFARLPILIIVYIDCRLHRSPEKDDRRWGHRVRARRQHSGASLYHTICVVLRDGIASGRLKPGLALPTEDELARDYDVSRVTVRRALAELAADGLIERRQGSGTFVRSRPADAASSISTIISSISAYDDIARRTTARIIEFGYIDMPPELLPVFGQHAGERLQRAVRLREAKDEVLLHITTWIPEKLARAFDSADMEREPVNRLLERSGVRQSSGERTVSVTVADPGVSRLMGIDIGTPLLRLETVLRDQRRRVVQRVEILARADRFNVRMKLSA